MIDHKSGRGVAYPTNTLDDGAVNSTPIKRYRKHGMLRCRRVIGVRCGSPECEPCRISIIGRRRDTTEVDGVHERCINDGPVHQTGSNAVRSNDCSPPNMVSAVKGLAAHVASANPHIELASIVKQDSNKAP